MVNCFLCSEQKNNVELVVFDGYCAICYDKLEYVRKHVEFLKNIGKWCDFIVPIEACVMATDKPNHSRTGCAAEGDVFELTRTAAYGMLNIYDHFRRGYV